MISTGKPVKSCERDCRPLPISSANSPSPQPSPAGKGGIATCRSNHPGAPSWLRTGLRVSLSLRERVGVRGNKTPAFQLTSVLQSALHP